MELYAVTGRSRGAVALAASLALMGMAGCHKEEVWEPMLTQKVYVSDRFYDLEILGPKEAMVVGYNGKVLSTQRKQKAIKRLKIIASFNRRDEAGRLVNNPKAMVLDVIPVIPPDLRPMVQLDGGRFATSDLND